MMEVTSFVSGLSSKVSHTLDRWLNALRRRLKWEWVIRLIRVLRPIIHFGPWRIIPRFFIRKLRPADRIDLNGQHSLFSETNCFSVAERLNKESYFELGQIPETSLKRIRSVSDHIPVNHYQLVHQIDPDVYALVNDPLIKNILRAYFQSEPVILESTLMITGDSDEHGVSEQNNFHFDYAGWQSLNLFVYLTDVTEASSAHVVVKGSHQRLTFRDIARGFIPDDEVKERFGEDIQPVLGPAGLVFFENTEALHKRLPGKGRRAMLNILFASHKSWLSHGRTSQSHINNRKAAYESYRKSV